jgi:hypothetical protein
MRRWVLRIFIGLVILIVVVIAAVQVVLWTPLPRRIAIQQVEKILGLRISAQSLSISWLGRTELRDVSLGLPLGTGDFLKVKALIIRHNTLFGLALGRAISLDSIEIDDPVVEVVQDAQGQWNLQQVATLLAKAGGSNTAQQPAQQNTGVPKLPSIKLVNGSVHVSDNQKHTLLLQPLNVSGQPDGNLVWKYDAKIADAIAVQGEVAPGGNWQHRVTLVVQHLEPLLKGWGVPTTYGAVVNASWAGQFSDGKVTGTLSIAQAAAHGVPTLGTVTVDGSIDVTTAGAVVTLRPNKVNLKTTYITLPNVGIQSGAIVSDETGLHAQSVKISALGGVADLNAGFDPRTQAVDLRANWSGLSLAKQTSQGGSLTASLRQPFPGRPVVNVELISNGTLGDTSPDATSPPSRWNGHLTLTGTGSSWKDIDWILAAPKLTYIAGAQTFDLSKTTAHITQHLPIVELTDLSLPLDKTAGARSDSANFTSKGRIDFAKSNWNFDAAGGFSASYQNTPVPIMISLHAGGNKDRYDLKSFVVSISDITFTTDGSYDRSQPKPVDLHVLLTQQQRITPDAPIQGEIGGKFDIRGLLFTDAENHFRPYLTIDGDLTSNDLVLLGRPVGDIDIALHGTTATPKLPGDVYGPIRTQIATTDFSLFEAPWSFSANYPNADGVIEARLETRKLPLEAIARAAKIKGITGEVSDAKWVLKLPSLSLSGIDLQSEYHLTQPAASGLTADTIDASVTLKNGVLRLNPLLAKSGSGTITTTANIDLKDPRELTTETKVDHWPYPISAAVRAEFSAHNVMTVDLHDKPLGASGTFTESTDVLLGGTPLAHLAVDADIVKRIVKLDKLSGSVLTGTFDGNAAIDLDKPLLARGQIVWKNVDAASVAQVFPALEGAGGIFSGAITLAPAIDPRPLEPVRVDINVATVGGHFRTLNIGGKQLLAVHGVGYLNTDRAVLDHSDFYLGGGVMHLWARVDNRNGAGLSAQTVIDFEHQQLDQWAHVDPKISQPMPGVFNAQIGLVRSGKHISQLLGSVHVDLTQTDLVNFGPLATLYNLMNAAGGISKKPNGTGSVDMTLEQSVLRVSNFSFFNRGIDARGLFTVGPLNFNDIGATPVGGQVVGTANPLKGTRLPLLSDFDSLYSAIAGQLTTVNINGSIDHPRYAQATLADIGTAMRELLVGAAASGAKPE